MTVRLTSNYYISQSCVQLVDSAQRLSAKDQLILRPNLSRKFVPSTKHYTFVKTLRPFSLSFKFCYSSEYNLMAQHSTELDRFIPRLMWSGDSPRERIALPG